MRDTRLARYNLVNQQRRFPKAHTAQVPRKGWIEAIRTSIGMTQDQLAARCDKSGATVRRLERLEAREQIRIADLDRLAQGMECRLVYAIVPVKGTLEDFLMSRIKSVAAKWLRDELHEMKLDGKQLPESSQRQLFKMYVEDLLRGDLRRLW